MKMINIKKFNKVHIIIILIKNTFINQVKISKNLILQMFNKLSIKKLIKINLVKK
jgi:hypothetical protein